MSALLNPLTFLVACLSGWLNEHQQYTIDYLTEENRVLREQICDRRFRFTCEKVMENAVTKLGFSARGYDRLLKSCSNERKSPRNFFPNLACFSYPHCRIWRR